MPYNDLGAPPGRADLSTLLTWLGLVVVTLTGPLLAGTAAGLVTAAGSPAAALQVAGRAVAGPLLAGAGLPWAFHVAVLVFACGCWVLGAGLVLDGLD